MPLEPWAQAHGLAGEHHYLGGVKAVGEQFHYALSDAQGGKWLTVLIFAASALHLRERDRRIGWEDEQRRRRLALVTNNVRFLLLPARSVPDLGTAILRKVPDRLSEDWQTRYAHPIIVVETFVDPERFQGTVYKAASWVELGQIEGNSRKIARLLPSPRQAQAFVRAGTDAEGPEPFAGHGAQALVGRGRGQGGGDQSA